MAKPLIQCADLRARMFRKSLAVPWSRTWIRFGLVGLLNTGFGYVIFALLVLAGVTASAALVGTMIVAIAFNFYTSERLVFRSHGHIMRFAVVYTFILIINTAALWMLHNYGLPDLGAQALLALPVAILSYTGQYYFVFNMGWNMIQTGEKRRNLLGRTADDFKPPLFKPNISMRNQFENWLRRFFDLQAASVWSDMQTELSQTSGRLLDVGCGARIYRELVPEHVVYRAIDTINANMHFGYTVPDTLYFSDEDWGVGDGTFDTVLCTEVLEHIADSAAFLARAYRCLRPGGRLVLTVPFAARWHFIPFDYWRFTPTGLARILTHAGFAEVHVQARGNPLTVACYKMMTLHFMLLFGHATRRIKPMKYAIGILMLPVLGVIACVAHFSLRSDWGDDCLGYTVTARSRIQPAQPIEQTPP